MAAAADWRALCTPPTPAPLGRHRRRLALSAELQSLAACDHVAAAFVAAAARQPPLAPLLRAPTRRACSPPECFRVCLLRVQNPKEVIERAHTLLFPGGKKFDDTGESVYGVPKYDGGSIEEYLVGLSCARVRVSPRARPMPPIVSDLFALCSAAARPAVAPLPRDAPADHGRRAPPRAAAQDLVLFGSDFMIKEYTKLEEMRQDWEGGEIESIDMLQIITQKVANGTVPADWLTESLESESS